MIYDTNGNLKDTVLNQMMNEGIIIVNMDVKSFTPGMYY